jgi:hypothetical protein
VDTKKGGLGWGEVDTKKGGLGGVKWIPKKEIWGGVKWKQSERFACRNFRTGMVESEMIYHRLA